MVPHFAADGVGKMKKGGPAKRLPPKKKAPTKGKKKMAYGGAAKKPMGMMYGGKPIYKSRMS